MSSVSQLDREALLSLAQQLGTAGQYTGKIETSDEEPTRKRRRTDDLNELLNAPTAADRLLRENLLQDLESVLDVCLHTTRTRCGDRSCEKIHFSPILRSHTDPTLGHCSFLNTCHRPDTCRYLHFELEEPSRQALIEGERRAEERLKPKRYNGLKPIPRPGFHGMPAQFIDYDIRHLDVSILPKFECVLIDPPWDIHQQLPYATLTDDEMRALPMPALQDDGGLLFIWVTGRAMELARVCLADWGFQRIDEIIWLKTNQLGGLIRAGRTGHWLQHCKEHCLVAVKRSKRSNGSMMADWTRFGIDTDTIVAEVRETSRKPDELYDLIERACPGGRKLECVPCGSSTDEQGLRTQAQRTTRLAHDR